VNELVPLKHAGADVEAYRASTEAATLCKEIVVATSSTIQGRRYVSVEGWQAIARAHGCAAGASHVERIEGGVRAIGEVRDILTGQLVAQAEGFVGEDEPTWYGGQSRGKTLPKRADYAIRAMAQTRAMSRACRSAFAHVVVMMNAGLATTPAEEVPQEGFDRETGEIFEAVATNEPAARQKLDGPYTSKTALQGAVKALAGTLENIGDTDELNALMETRDFIELEKQAARDLPSWWETGDGLPEEFVPMIVRIERRKKDLEAAEREAAYLRT